MPLCDGQLSIQREEERIQNRFGGGHPCADLVAVMERLQVCECLFQRVADLAKLSDVGRRGGEQRGDELRGSRGSELNVDSRCRHIEPNQAGDSGLILGRGAK